MFRELPTVVRRSFDAFLQRFQDENPGSNLSRTDEPIEVLAESERSGYAVPFTDLSSGARYKALVGDDGSVSEAVRAS